MIKCVLGMGSLAYSAWQLPRLMDKLQPNAASAAQGGAAGPGGALGILQSFGAAGALAPAPGAPGAQQPANPVSALLGAAAAHPPKVQPPAPLPPADASDLVLYSADGKPLTPEQREKALKEAARKAPMKPGANVKINKKGASNSPKPGAPSPAPAPDAALEAQALEDITRQLQQELGKPGAKKP